LFGEWLITPPLRVWSWCCADTPSIESQLQAVVHEGLLLDPGVTQAANARTRIERARQRGSIELSWCK
jgi:hypothetical protein